MGNIHGQVTAIFLRQCHRGENITLHGDGSQTRCFTRYSDLIDGIIALGELDEGLDGSPLQGASFNIGSTDEVSIHHIAELAREVTGADVEIVMTEGHPGDSTRRVPDVSAAQAALGWSSTVDIAEGMLRCWEWIDVE